MFPGVNITSGLPTHKAVVLAAGLGTRMRRQSHSLTDSATRAAAQAGLKAMMPLLGRPFMDYILKSLFDAGLSDVCLVVRPGRTPLHERYEQMGRRLPGRTIRLVEQREPRGTADAVLAAQGPVGQDNFIVINGDNLYPAEALTALRAAQGPGLVAFDRDGLAKGNFSPERVAAFAVLELDSRMHLRRVVEKPPDVRPFARDGQVYVSMNCWHFTPDIFTAIRAIKPHPVRQELELPSAVQHAVDEMGMCFQAIPCRQSVLDLTAAEDVASLESHLAAAGSDFRASGIDD